AKRVELMNDARERIASLMVDYQQLSADLASLEEKVASGSFLAEDVMAETSKLKVQAQNITNGLTTWTSVLEKFK
ncbi:MAG: hypothetical protein NTV48_02740, partial [Candidatus Vogelbacteria bacterium]|nr:hypothetical protein [Candidatus Vogelbacteria bacterium]